MMTFTTEQAWVAILLGVPTIIGAICFMSEVFSLLKMAYEARLDKQNPARLQRFSLETYSNGVKDATKSVNVNAE